ncbi:Protein argonaute [Elasticomyces elasticus]|nr:Protein argonaute [Elasticomyces elasticus]KAK4964547.1 Protein argonaute [Elasticomyces elasticus]
MECHELENGQHSKPQHSPSALEDPPSHGKRVDADAEVVVAVHRYDATSPTVRHGQYRVPSHHTRVRYYLAKSSTLNLNSEISQASTAGPGAPHEEIQTDNEVKAARQEEAEKLKKYGIAINSLAERERELKRASEACGRDLHQFLKHGLDEDECDRTHAEWARLREKYEEEVMWQSRVLYEQISDGVKKSMFEGMDLGDPHFVFASMTTMLRGQLDQRLQEGAARTVKASPPHSLVAICLSNPNMPTQAATTEVKATLKYLIGHDTASGSPQTKVIPKDDRQQLLDIHVHPIRFQPLSCGTAYQFEVETRPGEQEDSLAGKVVVSRAIQKTLGAACVFDGNSTAWSLEPLGQKRGVIITPSAKHVRGTPLPQSHIFLRQTRCYEWQSPNTTSNIYLEAMLIVASTITVRVVQLGEVANARDRKPKFSKRSITSSTTNVGRS